MSTSPAPCYLPFRCISARKDLGSVANSKASQLPLASSAGLQPHRVTICLLSASLSWKPSSILSHIRHLSLCRSSASSGGVSCFLPFHPVLSSVWASSKGCLALSHTSRAGIRSGSLSLFFMGMFGSNWSTQADCKNLSSLLVFPAIHCTGILNQARGAPWGDFI